MKTPDELYNDPDSTPMKPTVKGPQASRPGGAQGADKDFHSLGPTNIVPMPTDFGPGLKGILPGGGSVSVRPGSSKYSTQPTIQTNEPCGKVHKFRYP